MVPGTAEATALKVIGSDEQTTDGLALALPPEKEPAETQLVVDGGSKHTPFEQVWHGPH
jgi:hypothetical protein